MNRTLLDAVHIEDVYSTPFLLFNRSIHLTVLSVSINTVDFLTLEREEEEKNFRNAIMFAEKSVFPSSNNLHLPSIGQSLRQRIRPPPTPLFTSRAAKAAHIAENVSALKAKYADYNTWLKTSTRPNHEPALTQDILKHSLCQMGIDTGKAEQLVSTCSWYVYQFEKDLKRDPTECSYSSDKKTPKLEKLKLKKTIPDSTEDSITPINSLVHGM